MARFRPRTTFRLAAQLHGEQPAQVPAWKREEQGLSRSLHERWSTLHRHCSDQSSHLRLNRLVRRLTHYDCGVRESALAELELATQLIRTGIHVTFLPESQARTADLECRVGGGRFFVEVTTMVGSAERQRLPLRGLDLDEVDGEEEDRGVILTHRILARIRQKAKQLADYCDPVVLGISIPRADLQGDRTTRPEEIWLDLKMLAGTVTVLLMSLRSISAVMISLWDVEPLPSKAGTRLANVELIERPKQQKIQPRVRILIHNPSAASALTEWQQNAFLQIL
ncbi:MAG: hypothetical protein OEV01_09150 [Nitrospira sp.]|nr:hypothetical protein [Nitrospira sp.]MDH4303689.1 hypothetical protein [Nitrospira sp.]MDH5192326.1 hypothetical protein [Nitrospira sp.]